MEGSALLRVAAVQLNSTADKAANMAAADRLTRAAAADGARLIVLPEKWTVLGTDEDLRAGAETLDGPADLVGAGDRAGACDRPRGGVDRRAAWRGGGKLANTSVHVDPAGRCGRCTASCTCSTSRSRAAPTASPPSPSPGRRSC